MSHLSAKRYAHIFFMDGVGLGSDDPAVNPFVTAPLPYLNTLFGNQWYVDGHGRVDTPRATLVPTDPNLGVGGRPQSATGQATILAGRNIPALIGEHYGPKPNKAVAARVREGTLFHWTAAAGGNAALLSPYPQGYFDAIASGRRLYSSVPLAVTSAGYGLYGAEELRTGRAVSPGFTNQAWHELLNHPEMPILSFAEAGQRLATIAADYHFSFFEHWPSDRAGHRGTLEAAANHLSMLDNVIGALIESWDDENGLLIITSDHGNIEEKNRRTHTTNPVPTIIVGPNHGHYADQIMDLSNIAPVVADFLGLRVEYE